MTHGRCAAGHNGHFTATEPVLLDWYQITLLGDRHLSVNNLPKVIMWSETFGSHVWPPHFYTTWFVWYCVQFAWQDVLNKLFTEKDKKPPEKTFKETVGKEKEAVKITDFPPPARIQESAAVAKSKVPLLPLPTDPRLSSVDHSRRPDEVPIRSFYKPAPVERLPSAPDPGRISIRNSFRETLLNRQGTAHCLR